MANESYWNKEFAQIQEYVYKADSTRPHTFHDQAYGGFNNQGSTAPIANIHYPGPDGYKVAAKSNRPMVYGEYCHLNVYNRSELVTDPGIRSDWALALAPTWEICIRPEACWAVLFGRALMISSNCLTGMLSGMELGDLSTAGVVPNRNTGI